MSVLETIGLSIFIFFGVLWAGGSGMRDHREQQEKGELRKLQIKSFKEEKL